MKNQILIQVPELVEGHEAKTSFSAALFVLRSGWRKKGKLITIHFDKLRDQLEMIIDRSNILNGHDR